jgi:hypothetical protein
MELLLRGLTKPQRVALGTALWSFINVIIGVLASLDRQIHGVISAASLHRSLQAFTNHDSVYSNWLLLSYIMACWIPFSMLINGYICTETAYANRRYDAPSFRVKVLCWLYGIAILIVSYLIWYPLVLWITSRTGTIPAIAQVITVLTPLTIVARWSWVRLGRHKG